jgi:hypothetical protein
MKTKSLLIAIGFATAGIAMPVNAQPASGDWHSDGNWNRGDRGGGDDFWRGAPSGLRERIDWLQQRINRGASDGSLGPQEAHRAQWQLESIKRDAATLQQRLDDLSRNIRWLRHNGAGGYGGPGDRDPYATDYDASRYYRDDPHYQERHLSANDEVYRGSDGRYYCKRNDGTTGLIIGAVGGGAIGNVIDGGHNRVAGTLIGGALGALAGKAIDQNSDVRCR